MSEAIIDISGKDKNVLELQKQIGKGFDKIAEAIQKTEQTQQRATKTAESHFSKIADGARTSILQIAGIASGVGLLQKAWELAAKGIEHYTAQYERARQTMIPLAGQQLQAASAFMPDQGTPNFAAADARLEQISNRLSIPLGGLYMQAEKAFGAGGMLSNEQKLGAVETVAGFARNMPDVDKAWLQNMVMQIMSSYKVDARTALGLVLQGNAGHATTNLAAYSQHVSEGIKTGAAYGATLEEGFALTNAMSQATADVKGRESTTAMQRLMQQVFEETSLFPENEGKTLDQRLAWLHSEAGKGSRFKLAGVLSDEARAAGYVAGGTFSAEAGSLMAGVSIITGKGEGWDQYTAARSKGVSVANAGAFLDAKSAEIGALPLQQAAAADLATQAEIERLQLSPGRAYKGIANDAFYKLVDEIEGLDYTAGLGAKLQYKLRGGDYFDAGESVLRERADIIRNNLSGFIGRNLISDDERLRHERTIQALEQAADNLDRIQQNMKGGLPAANGDRPVAPFTGDPLRDAAATAGPAARGL